MELSLWDQLQLGDIVQLSDDRSHVTTDWYNIFFVVKNLNLDSVTRKKFRTISKAPSPGEHNLARAQLRDFIMRDGKRISL